MAPPVTPPTARAPLPTTTQPRIQLITNATAATEDGRTITALLAARETLRSQHRILVRAADAAAGSWGQRQMRSELRQMSALPVRDVRAKADGVAQALRELDVIIQRTNWEVELLEA